MDGVPVGWARFTPRSDLGWLTARFRDLPFRADAPWALPCFFVPGRHRGRGVMRSLIDSAAGWAGQRSVAVEAYPVDPDGGRVDQSFAYVGLTGWFEDAGFERVLRTEATSARLPRWLVRREL